MVYKASGSAAEPSENQKLVMFVIERSWSPDIDYGQGGTCTSGGMNHATYLLSAFLTIASAFAPEGRRPIILAPGVTFDPMHGEIPLTVR